MSNTLGLDEQHFRTFSIFFPFALNRTLNALQQQQRFVHYTSAQTAMQILQNGVIWMRKSHLMNDYREVEHGFDCLNDAYKKNKERMTSLLDGMFPGFCEKLETAFNNWLPLFRTDSFITCVSEHDSSEDAYGRLSMWRAYGNGSGVALVVNGGPLLRPSNALLAYTNPVAYMSNDEVEAALAQVLTNVENNQEFVRSLGENHVLDNMFQAFRSAILCTKHPGFREEREWRVVYSPSLARSERITSSVESVNGIPQLVCKIPLKDVPEEGLTGLAPMDFIEKVIIGPTKFPAGIYDAFTVLLGDMGIPNPTERIVFSNIPLRQ